MHAHINLSQSADGYKAPEQFWVTEEFCRSCDCFLQVDQLSVDDKSLHKVYKIISSHQVQIIMAYLKKS